MRNQEKNEKRKTGKKRWLLVLLILVLLLIALLLCWMYTRPKEVKAGGPQFAPNAVIGALPDKSDEEIEAMLNQKVKEGMVAFSIKYEPAFDNGSAEGELKLESPGNNTNYIYFTINRDDTGEEIYKSGLLSPNSYIYKDKLQSDPPLAKGLYPCTATIHLVDKNSLEEIGFVQASLKLTILN